MYRSVLRDILYLKVSGNSFGGKTYDNCKNAMYGIQQIVGSCWFNSTINGFLLSEYSRNTEISNFYFSFGSKENVIRFDISMQD